MLRRNLKYSLIFILVVVVILALDQITYSECDAINGYHWAVLFGLDAAIGALLIMALIFIGGVSAIFLLRKYLPKEKYQKLKMSLTILLALGVFYEQVMVIPLHLINGKEILSICGKSTFNGVQVETKDLSTEEYNYLTSRFWLMPTLPSNARSINTTYYHDNFLGDYMLRITFLCPVNEPIDTNKTGFSIDRFAKWPAGLKSVEYYDSKS